MADVAREKAVRLLKTSRGAHAGSVSSSTSEYNVKRSKKAGSVSTLSFADGSHDASSRPGVRLENTYQLEPAKKFPAGQVEQIMKQLLEEYLEHESYKPDLCRQMSKSLSEVLRARVKELVLPRYKIICLVHIGQLGSQCMRIGSRCLWDAACDTYSTCEFKNNSLFAVCTVYAVYSE